MSWSPLFDRTHILKGVPVDADIELRCKRCRTLFKTKNAYHIGYSEILYSNSKEIGQCNHDLKSLEPTNNWFPIREIHKEFSDGLWASLFDYSHILEGAPIDADIELKCRKCNTKFQTKNAYYIGYSELFYLHPEEQGKCNHDLKDIILTKKWFSDSVDS
jgi:uncharacterized C2H2 Zn-finger protein